MKRFALGTLAAVIVLAGFSSPARAERPGKHPEYLHAIQDLKHARYNLERKEGDREMRWDAKVAISEVDAALDEIKEAAEHVGKDLEMHPPVDLKIGYKGRLHKALDLLRSAKERCRKDEDSRGARRHQEAALRHIDEAIRFTEEGIRDAR